MRFKEKRGNRKAWLQAFLFDPLNRKTGPDYIVEILAELMLDIECLRQETGRMNSQLEELVYKKSSYDEYDGFYKIITNVPTSVFRQAVSLGCSRSEIFRAHAFNLKNYARRVSKQEKSLLIKAFEQLIHSEF